MGKITEFLKGDKSTIIDFENPFSAKKVREIEFTIGYEIFDKKKVVYKARIIFRTNNTTAYHRINSKDFVTLQQDVELFIKSL